MSIERSAFDGLEGVYDQLKARRLWPLMAKHPSLDRETPHWHAYNNQIFVIEGTASFFVDDAGERYDLGGGDVCVVPSRTLHSVQADGPVTLIVAFDEPMSMSELKANPPEARG
jgi:mannose-6-phosphate isomerase-like protein (cupin superfamily)